MYNFSRNFACIVATEHLKEIWPYNPQIVTRQTQIIVDEIGGVSVTNFPDPTDRFHVFVSNPHAAIQKLHDSGKVEVLYAELALQKVLEDFYDHDVMYIIDTNNQGLEKAASYDNCYRSISEAESAASLKSQEAKVWDVRKELQHLRENPITF